MAALVFVLTFPFFPRSLPNSRPLLLRGTAAWARLGFVWEEESLRCKPNRGVCACFRTDSPLGPSRQHSPDPCDSNVNKAAFPARGGGPSVKTGKYREIWREDAQQAAVSLFFKLFGMYLGCKILENIVYTLFIFRPLFMVYIILNTLTQQSYAVITVEKTDLNMNFLVVK